MLVVQNANIAVLARALQQQKQDGEAAVRMIESSGVAAKGAAESGKGSVVDVVA